MTSFGQITVTDLNAWQARALRVLTGLQESGMKAQRHPLEWTITTNGALRGTVHRYDPRHSDHDRRAVFDEWAHVLGATAPREFRFEGGVRLTSVFTVGTERGDVQGSLVLDFDAADAHAD